MYSTSIITPLHLISYEFSASINTKPWRLTEWKENQWKIQDRITEILEGDGDKTFKEIPTDLKKRLNAHVASNDNYFVAQKKKTPLEKIIGMRSSSAAQSSSVFITCGKWRRISLVGLSVMIFTFSENAGILGAKHLFKTSFENLWTFLQLVD